LKHTTRLSLSLIFILTTPLIGCSVTSVSTPISSPATTPTPEPSSTPTLIPTVALSTKVISLENIDQLERLNTMEFGGKPEEFELRSMDFAPEGYVVTAVNDTFVYVWNGLTGQLINTFDHSVYLWNVAISPDGNLIASGDDEGDIKLWDLRTGTKIYTLTHHSGSIWCLAFSPDSKVLASGTLDDNIKFWDLMEGNEIENLINTKVNSLAFSPDGKLLAIGTGNQIILWDTISKKQTMMLDFHLRGAEGYSGIQGVLFSPDGTKIAAADADNIAIVWDVSSGKELSTIVGRGTFLRMSEGTLAFSPDSKIIATGNDDGNVIFWDMVANEELKTIGSLECIPLDLIFGQDGKVFEIGCWNGTVQYWGIP